MTLTFNPRQVVYVASDNVKTNKNTTTTMLMIRAHAKIKVKGQLIQRLE